MISPFDFAEPEELQHHPSDDEGKTRGWAIGFATGLAALRASTRFAVFALRVLIPYRGGRG